MTDEEPLAAPAADVATPRKGRRRARKRRRHVVAKVLLSTTLVMAMLTGLSSVYLYRYLNGNLDRDVISDQLSNRPDEEKVEGPRKPINILVMGSDTRDGDGNNIDGLTGGGERSDTTILMHLSADRKRAYGISIPRDTLVDRPDCKKENGDVIPGGTRRMWNEAFAVGGYACTVQQTEQVTGVLIHNYVVVDFTGFKDMVNAIDGVEVCIPEEINDTTGNIHLAAGTRELQGQEALDYVRVRYSLGDGSDIGRVKRQQAFIAAMAKKVVSGNTLTRPDRLISFLDAVTKSLTTDLESLKAIAEIGLQFQGIGLDKIQFLTVPWAYSTSDPGRVEMLPEAEDLWLKVRKDRPLGRAFNQETISAGRVPTSSASPDADGSGESPSAPTSSPSDDASADGQGGQGGGSNIDEEKRTADLAQAGLCT